MLKQCIKANFKNEKLQTLPLKLVIDEGMRVQYPNFAILAEIILTYPASTAVVERGFSYLNSTKSKFRNRLGSEHLDQLIRLGLNALPIEKFPFHQTYINNG